MLKKIRNFILILFPWFLSNLICRNYNYYSTINLPSFAIPNYLFKFIWIIIYILISISIYKILNTFFINPKEYKKTVFYNYLFNQLFIIIFFCFKNNFLAFIDVSLTFLTSLFLYYETKEINKKASFLLIPYVLFLIYALILSIWIYFINL